MNLRKRIVKLAETVKNFMDYYETKEDIEPGDTFSRVAFGVKQGQDITTHSFPGNVYGVWVSGDTDYWTDRLVKDYGVDARLAKNIKVRAVEGDRLIEDFEYMTDPDTGDKADSAILITSRPTLKYGADWVFEDELFQDEMPRYKEQPMDSRLKSIYTEMATLPDDDPKWDALIQQEKDLIRQNVNR